MKKLSLSFFCLALAALGASADDVTISVKSTTGAITGGNIWTSTATDGGPSITITNTNARIFDEAGIGSDGDGQNIGENLVFSTAAATRTITIVPTTGYYVSAINMDIRGLKADVVNFAFPDFSSISSNGTSQACNKTFLQGSNAWFTITTGTSGHDKKVICENLTVTLSPLTNKYYTGQEDKTISNTRKTTGITVTDDNAANTATLSITGLQTGEGSPVFFDQTTKKFNTKAGATVTVTQANSYSWMQNALYVDWASNGFDYTGIDSYINSETHALLHNVDLVATVGYQIGSTWYKYDGTLNYNGAVPTNSTTNGNFGNLSSLSFTVPLTTPTGDYRVRYKVDWNCLDPQGRQGIVQTNPNNNSMASNAGIMVDFMIHVDGADAQLYIDSANALKTETDGVVEALKSILTPTKYTDLHNRAAALTPATVNSAALLAAMQTTCNTIISEAYDNIHGKVITLRNINANKYFAATSATANGMVDHLTEGGKWLVFRNSEHNSFRLENVKQRKDIAESPASLVAHNSGRQFEVCLGTNGTNSGAALKYYDFHNGLAATGTNATLGSWGTDAQNTIGAVWELKLAGATAAEIDKTGETYYRIRAARPLSSTQDNSLLGINSVVDDNAALATEQNVVLKNDGLGTLWTIHASATETGKVYIRNAAADFEGETECYGFGANIATATTKGESTVSKEHAKAVEILSADGATGSTFGENFPQALCIRTSGTNNYLDFNGSAYYNGWDRVDNNFPNNGGIFYLEPVDAAEAQDIINAYITSVPGLAEYNNVMLLDGFHAIWAKADIDAALDKIMRVTTVAEANTFKSSTEIQEANVTAYEELLASANGKMVQFANEGINNSDARHGLYISTPTSQTTGRMIGVNDANHYSLSAIWVLEHQGGLNFKIKNYRTGLYMAIPDNGNSDQVPTAEGAVLTLELYAEQTTTGNNTNVVHNNVISFLGSNGHRLHQANNTDYRLIQYDSQTDGATLWTVTSIDDITTDIEVKITSNIDGNHVLSFEHNSHDVATHAATEYHADHKIKFVVTPKAQQQNTAVYYAAAEGENEYLHSQIEDGEIDLQTKLTNCDVNVTVPTGFFKLTKGTDTKLSKAINTTFAVDAQGTPTGIEEVCSEEEKHAQGAIYDLQGRRLAAPVKGINIIGGRKVLVK